MNYYTAMLNDLLNLQSFREWSVPPYESHTQLVFDETFHDKRFLTHYILMHLFTFPF